MTPRLHWSHAAGFLLPILILIAFLWPLHNPSPCADRPEECRPAASEAR
jgi:hypothetical protein